MELLLILICVAFCAAIFKVFRIPVNQWSLSTAVGAIVGIALVLLFPTSSGSAKPLAARNLPEPHSTSFVVRRLPASPYPPPASRLPTNRPQIVRQFMARSIREPPLD